MILDDIGISTLDLRSLKQIHSCSEVWKKGTTSVGRCCVAVLLDGCPVTILLREEFAAKRHPHPPSLWVLSPDLDREGQNKMASKLVQ
jgi:hypothetical protein